MKEIKDQMAVDIFGGPLKPGCCVKCKQPFTNINVHTEAGWRETKISSLCEDCFNEVISTPDDSASVYCDMCNEPLNEDEVDPIALCDKCLERWLSLR